MKLVESRSDWEALLAREYPGVEFAEDGGNPPGVNALAGGVLIGRYYRARTPPYGVIFNQPRSCSGKS